MHADVVQYLWKNYEPHCRLIVSLPSIGVWL